MYLFVLVEMFPRLCLFWNFRSVAFTIFNPFSSCLPELQSAFLLTGRATDVCEIAKTFFSACKALHVSLRNVLTCFCCGMKLG